MKLILLLLAFALLIGGAYAAYNHLADEESAPSNLQIVGDGSETETPEVGEAPSVQNPVLQYPSVQLPPAESSPEQTQPEQTLPEQTVPEPSTPETQLPSEGDSSAEEGDASGDQTQKPPEAELVPPVAAPTVKDFTVYDINGKAVKLSDYFGKPIVLNFFATWCQPCRNEMPTFQSHYIAYREDITFLFICLDDSVIEAKNYLSKQGYTFPILHDRTGSASVAFAVQTIPSTFFITREGELAAWAVGTLRYTDLTLGISKIK